MNWAGPWGGLDFLLESQAREYPDDFRKVLRAQWIGDALGEEDVSIRSYGKGGGLWNALAFYKKRAVVVDAEAVALGKGISKLMKFPIGALLSVTLQLVVHVGRRWKFERVSQFALSKVDEALASKWPPLLVGGALKQAQQSGESAQCPAQGSNSI